MVRQFTFNLYFHLLHLIHVVDVNKDRIFFSAFLDLQSIRDDKTTTSKKLFFFNALTDVPIII